MSINTNIRDCLVEHCFDLDLIAKKLNKAPYDFRLALNGELDIDDERNLTAEDLVAIVEITNINPNDLLGIPTR